MIKKLLEGNLSVQEFVESALPKEIITLYNLVLKRDEIALDKKYNLLSELIKLYPNVTSELYEVSLVKLFEHYETEDYFNLLKLHYEKNGKYKKLIELIEYFAVILEDEKEIAKLYLELGNFYNEMLLQPSIALKFYNKSLSLNPDNEDLEDNIDEILMAKNNWEKMIDNFESKLNTTDDNSIKSMYFLNIAEIHLNNSNNIEKAQEHLIKSIELNPRNEDLSLLIKRIFIDNDNIDTIIDFIIDKLTEASEENIKADYIKLLDVLFADSRVVKKKGFSIYETLLSLNPENKDVLDLAISYAVENAKYEELIELIENILKKNLNKEYQLTLINFLVEFIYEYTDNLDKAESYARKSESMDSDNFKYDYIYLEFYKYKGNNRKVFEILTKKIKSLENEDEIIEVYREMAEVAETANNIFKVTDSYKSILKIRPDDKDAIEALKRVYKDGAKWRALLSLLKDYISYLEKELETNLEEIIFVQEEIIDLTATQLKQDTTNLYKKLLTYDSKNITALNFLLDFNRSKGRWNEYIKVLIQKSDAVDEFEKIEIYFQIADVYTTNLRKSLEAALYYEKVLNIEADNGDALERLKEIYQSAKKYDKLYDLTLREIELSQSDDSKIEMLKELYDFALTNLKNDNSRITSIIEMILKIDENNIFAFKKILDISVANNDIEKQREALLKLYEFDKNPEVILSLAKLNDSPESFNQAIDYYLEFIQLNPENKEIIERLVGLYFETSRFEDIDSLFEIVENFDFYYETILEIINKLEDDRRKEYALKAISVAENFLNDSDKLLYALIEYNKFYHDSLDILDKIQQIYRETEKTDLIFSVIKEKILLVETEAEKIEIFEELTNLYIEEERYEDAFQNEKEKFLLTRDMFIIDNLNELSIDGNNRELFVNTLIDLIKELDDNTIIEELYNRAISVYTELDRYEDSKLLYFELIELKPSLKYIDNLIDLLALLDDYENLVKVYNKKLQFLSEDEKIDLLKEMASISFNKNKETEKAVSYLKKILELNDKNLTAINMLMFFYLSENKYQEWIDVAVIKSELVENEELEVLYLEISKIYLLNLNNLEKFVSFTDKAFEINIVEERLVELEDIVFEKEYTPLLDLLLKSYNKIENYDSIRSLLERVLKDFTLSEDDFANYKLQLADLLSVIFNEYELAYKYKKELYVNDLSNNEILNSLEDLSEKNDDFSDLISLLRQYKDLVEDKMVRINILARLGKIYDLYMKEHETAQSFYNVILEEDGDNLKILNSLEKIYLESENYEMLHDILLKKHRLLSDDEKLLNKVALARVEGLYFNKLEEAIELLDSVLDIDETIIEAYETKKMFYRKLENYDEIINILLVMENMLKSNDEYIVSVISELGGIYSDIENNTQKALEHYLDVHDTLSDISREKLREIIFNLFSDKKELLFDNLDSIVQFTTNRKLWSDLIKTYELMIGFSEENSIIRNFYRLIYDIYNEYLTNKENVYKTLFEMLKYGTEEENEPVLEEIFSFEFDEESILIEKLDKIASQRGGDYLIYKEIATIYQKNDTEMANNYFLKAFKNKPSDDDLFEKLLSIYQEKADYPVVRDLYLFRAESKEDLDDRVQLLNEAAMIEQDFIKDINSASETYMRIYLLNHSMDMFETLEGIYQETENWNKIIELYKNAVEFEDEYYGKKEFLLKIINVYSEILNDLESSVEFIKIMIDNEPQDNQNYEVLIDIYIKLNKFEELDNIYEIEIENVIDDEKEHALLSKAKNAKENLKDFDKSIEALSTLLTLNPYNEDALLYLEAFLNEEELILKIYNILEVTYETVSKWEELSELYNLVLEQELSKDLQLEIYSKLSNLYKENLNIFDKSLIYALKYFEQNPKDEDMIMNIEGLLDITESYSDFIKSIDKVLNINKEESIAEEADTEDGIEISLSDENDVALSEDTDVLVEETEDGIVDNTDTDTEANTEAEVDTETEADNETILSDELKLLLLNKKSTISEDFIEDKNVVISALYDLKELEPDNLEHYEKLAVYLTDLGLFEQLVKLLTEQIEIIETSEEKIELYNRIAEIYKEMINDMGKAVLVYQKILEIDYENGMALDELDVLFDEINDNKEIKASILKTLKESFLKLEDWDRYANSLKKSIDFTDDMEAKKEIFIEISKVNEEYLNNIEEAYDFYKKAFLIDFDSVLAYKLLELTDMLSNYEDFILFIEDNIKNITDEELNDKLHLKLGELYFEYMDNLDKAKEHFLMLKNYSENIDVLQKLEIIYQNNGDFSSLEGIYKNLSSLYDTADEKIDVLQKLATVQEYELSDKEATIVTLNRIIEISPENVDVLKALEVLNEGRKEALINIYKLILNTELEDDERVDVLLKLGRIYKDESLFDDAEIVWNKILDLNLEKKEAYLNLIEYYSNNNNIEKLAENYEYYLAEYGLDLEDEERISYFITLAELYINKDKLDNYKKAIEHFQAILDIEPQYLKSLLELKKIFLENDLKDEFFDVMGVLISTLEQGYEDFKSSYEDSLILKYAKDLNLDIKDLLLENFDLFEDKLIESENYDELIQIASRDLDVFPKRSLTLNRLIKVYESQEMFDELILILEEKLLVTEDTDEKLNLYRKIADISLDNIGDSEKAIESYKAIIELDSKNIEVIEKLVSLYEGLEEWEELIPLLELKIDLLEDNYSIYIKIIDTLINKTANYDSSFDYIYKTLNLFNDNEELLEKFNNLGELSASWNLYIETGDKILEILTNEELKNSLIEKIAIVYRDELGDIENSVKRYKLLLTLTPSNKEILFNLEALYSQEGNWDELSNILERIIELEEDESVIKEYYYKLSSNYEDNLENAKKASEVLEKLVELHDDELDALENLDRIYNDTENYPKLVEVYKKKIKHIDDYEDKINLWLQIIDFANEFDKNIVIQSYNEIIRLDINNEDAFNILEESYTNTENWDELSELLNFLIESDSNFKIISMLKLAGLLETKSNIEEAVSIYLKIIEDYEPENMLAADALIRIFNSQEEWDKLSELYKKLIDVENDIERRVRYFNSLANIYVNKYKDFDMAKEYFDMALQENPASQEATDGLFKIFEEQENWGEIINLLSDVANSTEDTDQAAESFYKIGLIHETKLDSLEEAKSAFELAISNKYDFIDAVVKLKDISIVLEEYESTISYLENIKELIEEESELVSINNEIGDIYIQKLDDPSSAIYAFEESLNLKINSKAIMNLSDLYFIAEDFDSLNKLYDSHFEIILENDRENRELHYFRRAMAKNYLEIESELVYEYSLQAFNLNKLFKENLELLYDVSVKERKSETLVSVAKQRLVHYFDDIEVDKLGDIYVKLGVSFSELKEFEKGEKYFNRALIIDEYNIDALKFAVDSYIRAAQWPKVIEYYNKILKKINDYDEKLKINYEIALIYKNELKNNKKAIHHFEFLIQENLKNITILNHMMDIYEELEDNKNLVITMEEKLNFIESNEEKEAIYYKLADLYYSKFNNIKNSLKYLVKILEFNYKNSKIISSIEKLLTNVSAFADLEKIYTNILSKLSPSDIDLSKYIYDKLSLLYTDQLQDYGKAVSVYEKLIALEPNNKDNRQKLIDLCERLPQFYDRAIDLHLDNLKNANIDFDSLHSLVRLYSEKKKYDRAFCYSALLTYSNQATEDEANFYNSYKPVMQIKINQTLSRATLERYIYPPNTNTDINEVFSRVSGIIADFYRKKKVKAISDIDVKRDLMSKESRVYKVAANIMNSIGLPNYDFYKSASFKGIRIENTKPNSVIVLGNDMVADRDDIETSFYLGRHLFYLLSEFYLVDISDSVGIGVHDFFKVILSVFIPSIQVGKEYAKLQKILRKSTPGDTSALIERLANSGSVDLNPWLKNIELTANRVALVTCGDINRAIKVIREDGSSFSNLSAKEKIDDLIKYSVSEQYLELRESLNIGISVK